MSDNAVERRTPPVVPVFTEEQQMSQTHQPQNPSSADPPQPYPAQYPAQYAAPQPARMDGLAIAAFVCGLCGLAIIPIVLGHISLRRIKRDGLGGIGFAVTGLVLGYLWLALWIVTAIVITGSVIWAVNS